MSESKELIIRNTDELLQPTTRRKFLGLMGVAGSVVLLPSVFAACSNEGADYNTVVGTIPKPADPSLDPKSFTLDLSTDIGILNYAFALEQLEAAFYSAAINNSAGFNALSGDEKEALVDIQHHEVIHREFFRTALGSAGIPNMAFNAATVATLIASRDVLLKTSQQLEDTGVSAYNGAGKYLTDARYLLVAGKIVSVEARHAAAIRDMRDSTGQLFAGDDVVDKTTGLDVKAEPATVLSAVVKLNVVASPLSIGTGPKGTATPDAPAPAAV